MAPGAVRLPIEGVLPSCARGFTPAELARLRVLRARYQANRTPFTTGELAHLHFVRWLHQTGRVVR